MARKFEIRHFEIMRIDSVKHCQVTFEQVSHSSPVFLVPLNVLFRILAVLTCNMGEDFVTHQRSRASELRAASVVFLICLITYASGQAAGGAGAGSNAQRAGELRECINSDFKLLATSWNESIMHDTPPNLYLEKLWWTPRSPKFEFTVITQLSLDRIPCSTYKGPVSAAVFLAVTQAPVKMQNTNEPFLLRSLSEFNKERIRRAVEELDAFHARYAARQMTSGAQSSCGWAAFDNQEATMLYPVNSLRNYARMQVKTELLSAIDVDMMISSSLEEQLSDPVQFAVIKEHALQQRAVVLPAFEPTRVGPTGRDLADKAVYILRMAHHPSSLSPQVEYNHMYEPWFITYWGGLPWFDVRFRGYGMNKIAHVASLNLYNFTFIVNYNAWIVHRPHADTSVRKVVAREASNVNKLKMKLTSNSLYNKVTKLFGEVKREMIAGTFAARLDQRMVKCFDKLAWLQPMPKMTPSPLNPKTFST
eukprot:gene16344-22539_t